MREYEVTINVNVDEYHHKHFIETDEKVVRSPSNEKAIYIGDTMVVFAESIHELKRIK